MARGGGNERVCLTVALKEEGEDCPDEDDGDEDKEGDADPEEGIIIPGAPDMSNRECGEAGGFFCRRVFGM